MVDWELMVPTIVMENLDSREKEYLEKAFEQFAGYPNLEQVWSLMDEAWMELGCDPFKVDERINLFYQHPVWILNGLFVEQHRPSLDNRYWFTKWVVNQNPQRVADFGGGFGGLARFVGEALPNVQVEVVDPHPHRAAIALAAATPNVRFVPCLTGEYDVLIATDVFEHVFDPIGLTAATAEHLHIGGQYLIANCFAPVILCHLPQLFHFNTSWDAVLEAMGLEPGETVVYGRAYCRQGFINAHAARKRAECVRRLNNLISWLPRGKARIRQILMRKVCR